MKHYQRKSECIKDSLTGFLFDPTSRKDQNHIRRLRKAWKEAEIIKGINILTPEKRVAAENAERTTARNRNLPMHARAQAAKNIIIAFFYSRSIERAIDMSCIQSGRRHAFHLKHPTPGVYVQHFVAANCNNQNIVDRLGGHDVINMLVQCYSPVANLQIKPGETYWCF